MPTKGGFGKKKWTQPSTSKRTRELLQGKMPSQTFIYGTILVGLVLVGNLSDLQKISSKL